MIDIGNINMIFETSFNGKNITILGTAHVSEESARQAQDLINTLKPDTVCIELCESRYHAIRNKQKWQETDIVQVIKEKKAFFLLSNLILTSFQKRIADKFEIKPGEEMIRAIETGESIGAQIHLVDRDIRITLSRVWHAMGLWSKMKLMFQMLLSLGDVDEIEAADIEKMKQEDVLETLLAEIGKSMPELRAILIDERDAYLSQKIKHAPGEKIVAVVGAGHLPGIREKWETEQNIEALEILPPKTRMSEMMKWLVPAFIVGVFIAGFFYGGASVGKDMIVYWLMASGLLAGLGAVLALAHPLTILASVLAAPITVLHPLIAVGWVAGLVEAIRRKPKVKDFEDLGEDILSIKGFWKNKITKILLVVVFTNLGASIGTFVAIPLMLKTLF
ncbi:MAG: TraB/GumN family protein [Proteobacteria bacterium]|nr:TraB/GumN family protein [Pseudomonadota bacterium]